MEEEIELIPVEGKSGFYRDPESTAVINCDKKAYSDYMKRKKISKAKSNELDKMKEDLNNVKGELGEIKGLLSTLVQKLIIRKMATTDNHF